MKRILVLENDAGVALLLCQVLSSRGYRVERAETGPQVLERLERGGPVDLLISDLFLSGMGGLEVILALEERGLALPVLVVSGYLENSVKARLQACPSGRGWLKKPFDLGELLERVEGVLRPQGEGRGSGGSPGPGEGREGGAGETFLGPLGGDFF